MGCLYISAASSPYSMVDAAAASLPYNIVFWYLIVWSSLFVYVRYRSSFLSRWIYCNCLAWFWRLISSIIYPSLFSNHAIVLLFRTFTTSLGSFAAYLHSISSATLRISRHMGWTITTTLVLVYRPVRIALVHCTALLPGGQRSSGLADEVLP